MMRTALRALARHAKSGTSGVAPVLAGSMPATLARFSHAASSGAAHATRSLNPWLAAFAAGAAAMPLAMAEANQERSFIMIKPDGVQRGLIADIIQRFERKGYKLVGIKILVPTEDLAGRHYAEHAERPFFPKLVKFLSSGPVVAMVWEGKEVIKYSRTFIGATNPLASAPGTIRGDYGIDVGRNVIHGSDSVESAQKEIALWFDPAELASWQPVAKTWIYE